MLIIGGCQLSLEREPHDTIEQIEIPPEGTAGKDGKKGSSDSQQSTSSSASQTILPLKLATPARGATAHIIENCLWVIGGCKGPKEHLTTVQLCPLDSANFQQTGQGTELKLLKERSCHVSAFSEKQRRLWVFGGFDGWECLNEVEMLDLAEAKQGKNFTSIDKLPFRFKNGAGVMNEADQCIYLIGGWDEKQTTGTVWKYSTDDGMCEFMSHLPHPCEGHACVYFPETTSIFIFGGYDGLGVTDRVMKYNIKNRQADLIYGQKLSEARENLVAQRIQGDKIVVCSGWNGHASSGQIDIFKYDPATDSVKRMDTLMRNPGALTDEDIKMIKSLQELEVKRNRPTSVAI